MSKFNILTTKFFILLVLVALLLPSNIYALSQEEAARKSIEMQQKYTSGDQEGAYQIFLELQSMGAPGIANVFIPITDAQIKNIQADLRSQNINKSYEDIKKFALEMEKQNRRMFLSYMQQDIQGIHRAVEEMNVLSAEFIKVSPIAPPKDFVLPTNPSYPIITPSTQVSEDQIQKWEKMLDDALSETKYMQTGQKYLNYTRTGLKISGQLAKVPFIGMIFDAINIPFDSLENYQTGDGIFKSFAKSLSNNTLHALTNLVLGPPVLIRKLVDDALDVPLEERGSVQDYRYFVKSVNNGLWDNGFNGIFGDGLDKEELTRRNNLGHYGNAQMAPR